MNSKLKIIFQILGIIGFIIISILSFIIPTNPFETIKGVNYDYPVFLCIIIGGSFLYLIILYGIYSLIDKMYIKFINKNNRA